MLLLFAKLLAKKKIREEMVLYIISLGGFLFFLVEKKEDYILGGAKQDLSALTYYSFDPFFS